jgi:predicted ribosome-associated RNA-binding protein Tma20
MRVFAWALLALLSGDVLPPLLLAGDSGSRAAYVGGTVAGLPSKSEGNINTTDGEVLLFRTKQASVRIPYSKINTIEYGQRVSRRVVEAVLVSPLLLLAKKRKHFLTVGYTDEQGHQQALVFQVDKGAVRAVLVSLEAKTGRKIEFQDEEARKAGKG